MSDKPKEETLRRKTRRAAMDRLASRPLDHITLEIRQHIKDGERHL